MNIPKEVIEAWIQGCQQSYLDYSDLEYIAQRAAEWALSQPVSMEHVTDGRQCWCNPNVIEEDHGNVIVHNYEDNWQQYAKPGETAQQCIERHRAEQDALMTLYAQASKPVSMEPVAWVGVGELDRLIKRACVVEISRDKDFADDVAIYTATQLAAARLQGAEEERKESRTHHAAWLNSVKRIASLEKSNAELEVQRDDARFFLQKLRDQIQGDCV